MSMAAAIFLGFIQGVAEFAHLQLRTSLGAAERFQFSGSRSGAHVL